MWLTISVLDTATRLQKLIAGFHLADLSGFVQGRDVTNVEMGMSHEKRPHLAQRK
jgi:hypothetical protein